MAGWLNRQESRYKLMINALQLFLKVTFFRGAKIAANWEGNRTGQEELQNKFCINMK